MVSTCLGVLAQLIAWLNKVIPGISNAFGGGAQATTLHPVALATLAIAVILAWLLSRERALMPVLAVGILVPMEQQVVLGGVHFTVLRIILLCAWFRVMGRVARGAKLVPNGMQTADKILMIFVVANAITVTLLWRETSAVVNRLGFLYDAFGIYFLIRHFVWDVEDVKRLVKTFAVICAVIAVLMILEQLTGRNMLSAFGAPAVAELRNGRIRSQGPFMHSIIAGTCGAILLPVFSGLWWSSRSSRFYAALGAISATIMIVTSASSTPVGTLLAAIVGMCMWPARRFLGAMRLAAGMMIVALHLGMNAPVWALIARIDFAGGSTGYQRFLLVDNFIHHFGEWWLTGTKENAQWGYDMWDSINWYVSSGISGGLVGLVLSLAILVYAFRAIGRFMRTNAGDESDKRFAWCLGSALFACAVAFFGIVFFDQSVVFWYSLLAMIVAITSPSRQLYMPAPPVAAVGWTLAHR